MNQQQIIEIIKANSKLSYEEMKAQAQQVNIELEDFEKAWKKVRVRKRFKYGLIVIIIITFISAGTFLVIKKEDRHNSKIICKITLGNFDTRYMCVPSVMKGNMITMDCGEGSGDYTHCYGGLFGN